MSPDPAAPRRVAVAVVVRGERVLVGRRADGAVEAAGLDEFPGGHVEAGESPEEAAVRECREEAGIAVTVERFLAAAAVAGGRGPLEILFFRCRADGAGEPREPFTWQPIATLDAARFPTPNAPVIASLRREHH